MHEIKFCLLLLKATKWFRSRSAIKEWFSPCHKKNIRNMNSSRKSVQPIDEQGIKWALRRTNHRRKPKLIICICKNRLVEVSALELFFLQYVWKTLNLSWSVSRKAYRTKWTVAKSVRPEPKSDDDSKFFKSQCSAESCRQCSWCWRTGQ